MSKNKLVLVCAFCLILFALAYFWPGSVVGHGVSQYLLAIQSVQRGLHASLSETVRLIHTDGYGASLILIFLSFIYGVFHAAGPGHGKVVISTYLLSHESQFFRGVTLSFAAAMVQGLTAIFLVCSAFWFLDLSMRQTRGLVNHFEVVSFATIALIGFYIICSHALRLWKKYSVSNAVANISDDGSEGCNHSHGPSAKDLEKKFSIRGAIGIVLSIGIRPCSGAVIVLLLSFSLDHVIAGLFAVLAMSLGTALTVMLLAAFSIYFRRAAQSIVKSRQSGRPLVNLISDSFGIFGGVLIFILGISLFASALMAPVHPFR